LLDSPSVPHTGITQPDRRDAKYEMELGIEYLRVLGERPGNTANF
jgi:hypothetical protein